MGEIIDLSRYNTITDYDALAKSLDFFILRLGGADDTEPYVDRQYVQAATELSKRGVPGGSYVINGRSASPEALAEHALANLHPGAARLIVLDVEDSGPNPAWTAAQSRTFWSKLAALGWTGERALYASESILDSDAAGWKSSTADIGVMTWCAKYSTRPPLLNNGVQADLWQYTSSGTIPGVQGVVDLNKNPSDRFKRLLGAAPVTPTPAPEPTGGPMTDFDAGIAWINATYPDRNWNQRCGQYVWNWIYRVLGYTSDSQMITYPTANAAYRATDIVSLDPYAAPPGAMHFWEWAPDGHVGMSLGGGQIAMTGTADVVDKMLGNNHGVVSFANYSARKTHRYLGWGNYGQNASIVGRIGQEEEEDMSFTDADSAKLHELHERLTLGAKLPDYANGMGFGYLEALRMNQVFILTALGKQGGVDADALGKSIAAAILPALTAALGDGVQGGTTAKEIADELAKRLTA